MNIQYYVVHHKGTFDAYAPQSGISDLSALAWVANPNACQLSDWSMAYFFGKGGVLAFACCEGRIVGAARIAAGAAAKGASYRIEHVAVLPSHEGQGIDRKLFSALLSVAKIHDMGCLVL